MNNVSRVGIGHDTHRLIDGDGIRLGGVFIPHEKSLLGVSDADVLLHAIIDALLGAAAMGDIGEMFPDTDEINRNRSSVEMLQTAYKRVQAAGWKVQNLDCIVFAQRPNLSKYKADMVFCIAQTLDVTPEQVNVKAKTGEGVGIVGEEIVIEAQCVVLLVSNQCVSGKSAKALAAARPVTAVPPVQTVSPALAGTTKANAPSNEPFSTILPIRSSKNQNP